MTGDAPSALLPPATAVPVDAPPVEEAVERAPGRLVPYAPAHALPAPPPQPKLTSATYAVRAPLLAWLGQEATLAAMTYGAPGRSTSAAAASRTTPLFASSADSYFGVDVDTRRPTSPAPSRAFPVPDGRYDVVLCTQVLEHALDPAKAVAGAPARRPRPAAASCSRRTARRSSTRHRSTSGAGRTQGLRAALPRRTAPGLGDGAPRHRAPRLHGDADGIYVDIAAQAAARPLARQAVRRGDEQGRGEAGRPARRAGEPRPGGMSTRTTTSSPRSRSSDWPRRRHEVA